MIIEVPSNGIIRCSCGKDITVDLLEDLGVAECECGQRRRYTTKTVDWIELFGLFGVTFSLDWDGQLIADCECECPDSLWLYLFEHQNNIRDRVGFDGKMLMSVYCGGPLDSVTHGCGFGNRKGERFIKHISRANWAVYECRENFDPRLYYVGSATSEAKARRSEFKLIK